MKTYWLKIVLLSDATFSRGDGVAGLVDAEVQHDALGLPYLNGKTLKGLLMAECAEILASLSSFSSQDREEKARMSAAATRMETAARGLFGDPGSQFEQGKLHIGPAELPVELRQALQAEKEALMVEFDQKINLSPKEAKDLLKQREYRLNQMAQSNLESLTSLRRQTSMDPSGAPRQESLRTMRVILRSTPFYSRLDFTSPPTVEEESLLSACVLAFRRAGSGKHRGRGRLSAELLSEDGRTNVTQGLFKQFQQEVQS